MSSKSRVGGLKVKHVEAALQTEEQALTTIHVAVTKQLRRLEVEEQLLQEMLKRAEQEEAAEQRQQARGEAAGAAGAGQRHGSLGMGHGSGRGGAVGDDPGGMVE